MERSPKVVYGRGGACPSIPFWHSFLECVGETLRAVLEELAALAPEWLVAQIGPDWFERYSHRVENYRLPKAESQRTALAQQIGADGRHLLQALEKPNAPEALKDEACVQLLRQVWEQYYDLSGGKAKWRADPQVNAGEGIIRSPYDPEARARAKSGRSGCPVRSDCTRSQTTGRVLHLRP